MGHYWPLYILDLNPLDSFEDLLRTRKQQEFIPEQQEAVTDIAATIPMEKLRNAAQNVRKCAKACIEASGGHCMHFL